MNQEKFDELCWNSGTQEKRTHPERRQERLTGAQWLRQKVRPRSEVMQIRVCREHPWQGRWPLSGLERGTGCSLRPCLSCLPASLSSRLATAPLREQTRSCLPQRSLLQGLALRGLTPAQAPRPRDAVPENPRRPFPASAWGGKAGSPHCRRKVLRLWREGLSRPRFKKLHEKKKKKKSLVPPPSWNWGPVV